MFMFAAHPDISPALSEQNRKYERLFRLMSGCPATTPRHREEKGQAMTTAERVAALRKRRQSAGLVRVEVYVPADRVEDIRDAAREMREGEVSDAGRC